jgi:hypothetical protein
MAKRCVVLLVAVAGAALAAPSHTHAAQEPRAGWLHKAHAWLCSRHSQHRWCEHSGQTGYCPPSTEPHTVPLVTHFLQGAGASLLLHSKHTTGINVNFTAPLSGFAKIAPYIYAMFGEQGSVLAKDSKGRLDHGFLTTAKLLATLEQEYDRYASNETLAGYPDTIGPTIHAHVAEDGSARCDKMTTMKKLRYEGCRPAANGVIAFQNDDGSALSATDSVYVVEILDIRVKGEEGEQVVEIDVFAPNDVPLVDEGASHLTFGTAAHYHWSMDCASAVDTSGLNAKKLRELLESNADLSAGLFALFVKGG